MIPPVFADLFYVQQASGRVPERSPVPNLADSREKLEAWRRYYDEDRPHSAIGYNVPIAMHNPRGDTNQPSWRSRVPSCSARVIVIDTVPERKVERAAASALVVRIPMLI